MLWTCIIARPEANSAGGALAATAEGALKR
jgi:hypothetical protein